jgi:hypothetical protein
MKAWSLFLKDVMPHVPGCPEPVAEHALLRAAQEFFDTTRLWKVWLGDLTTEADTTEYPLLLEEKSELVRLERATLDGREIEVRAEDELPADWLTYPSTVCTGVHTTDRETVVLVPAQAADLVLKVQASLKPANNATGVADEVFDHCVKQIACGAVAALMEHSGKTYSDPVGAGVWRTRFDGHMAAAEFRRARGYTSARRRRVIQAY